MILPAVRVAIVGALTIGSMFGAVSIAHADPSPAAYCAPTVVLAVDGTKGPETPDSIDPDSPLNSYTDQYRDSSDFAVRHVRYPAGMVAGVFGWDTFTASDTPEFRYTTFGEGDGALAGIMDASAFLPDGVPSHWNVYFAVDDTDATLAKIGELGGATVLPAEDTPYGRLAQASDPTGALFKLVAGS